MDNMSIFTQKINKCNQITNKCKSLITSEYTKFLLVQIEKKVYRLIKGIEILCNTEYKDTNRTRYAYKGVIG